jgi:hypothetical protein
VDDHNFAIAGKADIQLDCIGAIVKCLPKRGKCVLGRDA